MAYNDEKLLPHLLSHYDFADAIHVIIDSATTDRSAEVCKRFPNVDVQYFTFPDGFDDDLKVAKINEVAADCRDWVINVDTDEFAFCPDLSSLRGFLESTDSSLVYVNYWQVYRHRSESNLDLMFRPLLQRRHGDPNQGVCYGFPLFNKPAIVRRILNPVWHPGNHALKINPRGDMKVKYSQINGAHWAMADVDIAIQRRILGQQKRQSQNNLDHDMCVQHWNITEADIRRECEKWLDAPQLF
jgi:hypothetical protein